MFADDVPDFNTRRRPAEPMAIVMNTLQNPTDRQYINDILNRMEQSLRESMKHFTIDQQYISMGRICSAKGCYHEYRPPGAGENDARVAPNALDSLR